MYTDLSSFGKILIIAGIILAAAGILFLLGGRIPFLGKLPGDIYIKNKNFTFYFPIATTLLISIIIRLILYVFRK